MDVREKLIEILKQAPFEGKVLDEWWWEEKIKRIADHLISNGVTVQEWISVDDRLPERDGAYLTAVKHFGKHKGININSFAKDGKTVDEYELAGQKYVWYFYDSEYGYVSTDSVTHWMPLPQPPKGE